MHLGQTQNYNTYTQLQAVWKVHEKSLLLVIISKGNWSCQICFSVSGENIYRIPDSSVPDLSAGSLARTYPSKTGNGLAWVFPNMGTATRR